MVIRGLYGVCSGKRKTGELLANSSGDIGSVRQLSAGLCPRVVVLLPGDKGVYSQSQLCDRWTDRKEDYVCKAKRK